MALQIDISTARNAEFREVFRNRYVAGFSLGACASMVAGLIFGLVFSAVLLYLTAYFVVVVLSVIFGLDLFGIESKPAGEATSTGSVIGFIVAVLGCLGFFAYLGPHSLIRFKRRLASRLYVMSGRPLSCVEGKPVFEPDSESGYLGIEIGAFYFNFEDCWLDVEDEDLDKLRRAGGAMRIWYIPTRMREWIDPATGKLVKYNGILVRAEWRPSS
jgi:hypothetical protein